jgi:UDP-N-acetylmuramyl pentapeptide phosphotransferase/UDP-N-acetylglucosamine-1-phosphate transferase
MALLTLDILLIFLSFLVSAVATRLAMMIGIHDIPNERSSHVTPVPRTGGIAIGLTFFAFLVPIFAFAKFEFPGLLAMSLFTGLAALIWTVALFDDHRGLGVWPRLLVQCAAGILFTFSIAHVEKLSLAPFLVFEIGIFGYLLSIAWIIFFMNCFNFMDGINGISAGTALAVGLCLVILTDWGFLHLVSLLLVGILAGFLIFNFPGGRIFMGDTGSQILGFLFAALALLLPQESRGALPFEIIPILFFPFIFDVCLTLLIRFRRGASMTQGHRDHLYQLLIRSGVSPVWVTLVYVAASGVLGAIVWALHQMGIQAWLWLLIAALLAHLAYAFMVYRLATRCGLFAD